MSFTSKINLLFRSDVFSDTYLSIGLVIFVYIDPMLLILFIPGLLIEN